MHDAREDERARAAAARRPSVQTRAHQGRLAMIALTFVLLFAGADEKASADAEAQAFAAVDAKHWCDAVSLFLAADAAAPSPDLVIDAAQAAEAGNDRA